MSNQNYATPGASFISNPNTSSNVINHSITTESTQENRGFNILDHLDKLTPTKTKGKYICPVCGKNDLSVSSKGAYQCWSGGCDVKDIREAISPWDEVKKGEFAPKTPSKKKTAPTKKPAPIPDDMEIELAWENFLTSGELAKRKFHEPNEKNPHGSRVIEYKYPDGNLIKRYENIETDLEKHPKGYSKKFCQYHMENGEYVKGKGDKPWSAFYLKSRDWFNRFTKDKYVMAVEGESSVDSVGCEIGIFAITFQGSDWKVDELSRMIGEFAGIKGIVFYPDNDKAGYDKAKKVAEACAKIELPCAILNPLKLWENCPNKGDIVDWTKTMKDEGLTPEEMREKLEQAFNSRDNWLDFAPERDDTDTLTVQDVIEAPNVEFTQKAINFLYKTGDESWVFIKGIPHRWTGIYYEEQSLETERGKIANYCNTFVVKDKKDEASYPYANSVSVDKVINWAKDILSVDSRKVNPPGLNCTNGILEIIWENKYPSVKFSPHSPEKIYTYQPLVKYDPDASPEMCLKMLSVLDKPQRDIFLKIIGASLDLPMVRKLKGARTIRGILALGDGNNGKDTLREAVSRMYGEKGMTGCTVTDFKIYDEGRKFNLSSLPNSRINWASENKANVKIHELQSLKAFLSGDKLDHEKKGKDSEPFTPMAVGIFNFNRVSDINASQDAIKSRYAVLEFKKTFTKNADSSKGEVEIDTRFKDDCEFIDNEVLPSFLNFCIDGLQRLIKEGIDYSCTDKALEEIQCESSHLFQFAQDTGLGYQKDSFVTAGELWESLEQWYLGNGTLNYEETSSGKQKAIWIDQANSRDKNVKGCNQTIPRIKDLFPKAKVVSVLHPSGKRSVKALQGISFDSGKPQGDKTGVGGVEVRNTKENWCGNWCGIGVEKDQTGVGNSGSNVGVAGILSDTNPTPTPIIETPTPIPHQLPHQETTQNQGFHTNHINFTNSVPVDKCSKPITTESVVQTPLPIYQRSDGGFNVEESAITPTATENETNPAIGEQSVSISVGDRVEIQSNGGRYDGQQAKVVGFEQDGDSITEVVVVIDGMDSDSWFKPEYLILIKS
ncbi:DUF5906 domain-containing protein [Limnofasciculus baicalensis]|uniref:SF3 helicase domain-containing protein n=1 Tax=Limnofasciculus baicalensis BBK-W-15 TaxID=2699891 RepID=A0AAE3GT70_9CYAN|nr:DUF5906 domain-containing protein [Limnofasciculus baicalensis]MCP2729864.1 hypothetical protein [Limnofasciculus baicalensis BBK-W-15]